MDLATELTELHQLQRELIEQRYLRRADALERVGEAVRRLGESGSPAAMIARSAEQLGGESAFDCVLVSRVQGAELHCLAIWENPGRLGTRAEVPGDPIPLGYPLVDAEVVQRHEAALVTAEQSGPRALPHLTRTLGWHAYVVAAVGLEAKTVGLVHATRSGDPPLDELDRDVAALYADGLGQAFERAVLRQKLQRQSGQLHSASQWISGRILELSREETPRTAGGVAGGSDALTQLLSPREFEVLRLISRGFSNRAIATSLVLREGTVKYHVKNILRKLQSRSRTEAVSRYMGLHAAEDSTP